MVSQAAFDAIRSCDYVFGCLDNDATRLVLNELCLAYSKPYFDLASDIPAGGTQYGGRVCAVWDDSGCLVCYGEIDAAEANLGFMAEEQRRDHEAIYGVPADALDEAGPSVVSMNGVVASLAVTEYMLIVTGKNDQPRKFLKYYGHLGIATNVTDTPDPDCYYCAGVRGKGDSAGLIRYLNGADC